MPVWLSSIVQHWGFKVLSIILVLGLIGGSFFLTYKAGYGTGYNIGYAKSLKDNPPNVYTGTTTVNQQPCTAPSVYGIDLGKWGFGLIHKK